MSLPSAKALTPLQIFETMRRAGFPPVVAVTMTAIALRESSGLPGAFNGNATTGDRSYGLLQINMRDANVAKAINEFVLKGAPETQLLDADTNARAGFHLWGHFNNNLDTAWYINRVSPNGMPTSYKVRYEQHLAEAQAAALLSTMGMS